MSKPCINFTETKGATPIAIVKGGDYNKKILYLHNDLEKKEQPKLKGGMKALKEIKNKDNDVIEIILPDYSSFELLPNPDPNKREIFYIAGSAGSGKSYIAKSLAEYYKKIFPEREIYLVSKLKEDATLDSMTIGKPKRLNVDTFVDDYPDLKEFQDCLIIFDDYDTFEPKINKVVQLLIDDIAIQGRHTNTSMICITHYLTNYKKTRLLLNEATHFIVYPLSTSSKALKYLLSSHLGLEKDDLSKLKKLGRWVCLSKNYPQYMISSQYAKILHQEE